MADLLYCYRCKLGLSIRQMAKFIGIHYAILYRFENGNTISEKHILHLICWVFSANKKQLT